METAQSRQKGGVRGENEMEWTSITFSTEVTHKYQEDV